MLVQETEIKAIHSQMNPHFIFNSLHLINHLISTKNYKKAEDLLINFSKLLRNVLEKSDQIFLPLSEELNFIKLYLNIQESRFNNQLKYTINCDPELNQIQIPAMILQPIVENAILHGIAHKIEGVGLISIRAIKEEGEIHIIIQDNGIGRKASKLINVTKSHRSAGYPLIQKKIDLLKIKYNVSVSYTITDINEKNNQTGTIVHLIIDYL
jgi:LytS/YehU family sensor histidine kinase